MVKLKVAQSGRYKALDARVSQLRKRLLPQKFSPTGTYTPAQLDKARAYRVLVHAELERYFEERSIEIATKAFELWKDKSKPSSSLACLLANIAGEYHGLPRELGRSTSAFSMAGKAFSQYKRDIAQNHGVRIANILQMLLPIGVFETEIEPDWLSTLDGFAAKRGAAAHAAAISYEIDPQDDYQTVTQIMEGLRIVDGRLNELRKRLR